MTAAFHIRPATPDDLDRVLALERTIATAPHWPRAVYEAIFSPAVNASVIRQPLVAIPRSETGPDASATSELLGFAVAMLPEIGSPPLQLVEAELESIAVTPSARRQGIGRALLQAAAAWSRAHRATAMVLEVRAGSEAALALYRRFGFTEVGRRPRYYRDPEEEALILRLELC